MTAGITLLEEAVALLAGHSSDFFIVKKADHSKLKDGGDVPWSWTFQLNRDVGTEHPGDRDMYDSLARIAAKYRRVHIFARSVQAIVRKQILVAAREKRKRDEWQNVVFSHLGREILEILKPYEEQVFCIDDDLQRQSCRSDAATATPVEVRARLEEWESSLDALNDLVSVMLYGPPNVPPTGLKSDTIETHDPPQMPICPKWTTGQLLDVLYDMHARSVDFVHDVSTRLLNVVEDRWCKGVGDWMCYGLEGTDASLSFGALEESLVVWSGTEAGSNGIGKVSLSASTHDITMLRRIALGSSQSGRTSDQESGWRFAEHALPAWIAADESISDAILFVGRAIAKVNGKAKRSTASPQISATMTAHHLALLRSHEARPCSQPVRFRQAIERVRQDISEWMWRNILTPKAVLQVFDTLGAVFLHRKGLFSSSLLHRLAKVRKEKLLNARSASAAMLHCADVELAMQRAGLDAENGEEIDLDRCKVSMPKQSQVPRSKGFDNIALGVPFTLRYQVDFPLDLIITPVELDAYSTIFSFLLAINAVRARLDDAWHSIGQAQRSRRRFTGIGEGGDSKEEARARKRLLRNTLGVVRLALWFINSLIGHFQTDVIDVRFANFIDQLDSLRPKSTTQGKDELNLGSRQAAGYNVEDWRGGVGAPVRRVSSMSALREVDRQSERNAKSSLLAVEPLAKQLGRASIARSAFGVGVSQTSKAMRSNRVQHAATRSTALDQAAAQQLDFTTLRACHQGFLAVVLESLTLTQEGACHAMWDVLHTSQRLTSTIERWGGDALPALLSEGSVMDVDAAHGQDDLNGRMTRVSELDTKLRREINNFIELLSDISTPSQTSHKLSPNEAQVAAMRHHEQLLLRLDFNRFISRTHAVAV